ncbi:hypothetical protein RUND412_005366 [Rhizina undulata]
MSSSTPAPTAPFYVPVDISHTALLLSDIQTQILARFPASVTEAYLATILDLLKTFRTSIAVGREQASTAGLSGPQASQGIPLIVHHTLPFGINSNSFVSPYNKLSVWLSNPAIGRSFNPATGRNPERPNFAVPEELIPAGGWGGPDEILLAKLQPGCFSSSDLLAYFRARGVKHVVLCGLTTSGSILGSARLGADLDFHMVVPREGVLDDDEEVNTFLLGRVLGRFVDVVGVEDVKALFKE